MRSCGLSVLALGCETETARRPTSVGATRRACCGSTPVPPRFHMNTVVRQDVQEAQNNSSTTPLHVEGVVLMLTRFSLPGHLSMPAAHVVAHAEAIMGRAATTV